MRISGAAALSLAALSVLQANPALAQVLAFDGAEGFGKYATGARTSLSSASVYHVTNLNDSGAGSFRDAVSEANRFVVFDVGGIINLGSNVVVKNNVTIAGQTAPGGITTFGAKVSYSGANNTVSRHMAYRLGRALGREDASGASNGANMMFDHMSITWGVDETFSFNSDGKGTLLNNITVQNSIIGQGLDVVGHSAAGLMTFPENSRFSLIKNLFTDSGTRNPKVRGENEFINNVVYGWTTAGYIMGDTVNMESHANVIGNYMMEGGVNGGSAFASGTPNFHIYGSGNYLDQNRDGVMNGSLVTSYPGADVLTAPVDWSDYTETVAAMTAQQAYDYVMKHAGPSIVRDAVDTRLAEELASYGTIGGMILRETDLFPGYGTDAKYLNPRARLVDSDNDGMPDNWETARGLNPNLNSTAEWRALNAAGYTRLEEYLNELGGDGETIMSAGGNWANAATWSGAAPTIADSAIVVGNLTVSGGNAFARRLAVGGNLTISGGTLDVFDTAQVDGTLSLTGGTATLGRILLSSTGTNGSLTLGTGSTVQTGPIANGGGTALLTFNGGTFKALGAPDISVPTLIGAAGGTINTNGYSGTLSGGLSGAGTLVKTGTGTLTLGGNNSGFTGGINITQGGIAFAAAGGAASGTGVVTMSNGTSFAVVTSNTTTPMTLASGATVTGTVGGNTYGGVITGPANSTLALNVTSAGTSNFSLGGSISGFAGTVNLGTSVGNLRINQGGSALANFNLGTGTATVRTAFGNTTNFGSLAGDVNTKLNGPTNDAVATTFVIGANGNSTTFAGTIGDGSFTTPAAVSVTKTGAGTLTLTGANTHTGGVKISAGTLAINAFTNGGVAGNLGASSAAAANLVLDGGTLKYVATSTAITATDRLMTLTPNGGTLDAGTAGQWQFTATGDAVQSGTGNRTLTLTGSTTNSNFAMGLGDPTSGKTALTMNGASTGSRWVLLASTNPRTYSGDTTVNNGTLLINASNVLPFGTGRGNVVVNANTAAGTAGVLELNGNHLAVNALNGTGTVNQRGSTTRTLTVGNGNASGSFAGTINDNPLSTQGVLNLTKTGTGTQTITGANTYDGVTTVAGGTLIMSASAYTNVLGNTGGLDVQNGVAVFDFGTGASPLSQIQSLLAAGYADGFTAGAIRSSTATGGRGLGYAVVGTTVVVEAVYLGDADLNGQVDFNDFLALQTSFGTAAGATYGQGDFNYDGAVDFNDFLAMQTNFGQSLAGDSVAFSDAQVAAITAFVQSTGVPEPTTLTLAGLAVAGLLRRRRVA